MARPKTKSSLVDGVTELVEMMRNIDTKLNAIIKTQNKLAPRRGRGRPPGTGTATVRTASGRGPGRPRKNKSGRGPGRPKKNNGRTAGVRRRGRPPGSKNKRR